MAVCRDKIPMELSHELASKGHVTRFVLMMDVVHLPNHGMKRFIFPDPDVEVVDDLFEDQDSREHEKGLNVGLQLRHVHLHRLVRIDLRAVLQAELREEPHMLVFFSDEVMKELGRPLIAGRVNSFGDLDQEFTNSMDVQTVEVNAFPLTELHQLRLIEFIDEFSVVEG